MALHGEIQVNGGHISRWWSQRQPGGEGTYGWNTYACGVVTAGHTRHFTVRHHYDDGAEVLAAKVLAAFPDPHERALRWGSGKNPDPEAPPVVLNADERTLASRLSKSTGLGLDEANAWVLRLIEHRLSHG